MSLEIDSVVETWIADRKLPRRAVGFLKTVHNQSLESIGSGASCHIAPRSICSELDLPQGSYWVQVVAMLLDHLEPVEKVTRHPARWVEVTEALIEAGEIEEGEAEEIFRVVL